MDALRLRRVMGRAEWGPPTLWGPDGWRMRSTVGNGTVVVTVAPYPDGNEWVHASMTRAADVPSYWDLKRLHAAVFDGWAYHVFPPSSEHVNEHEHCLHLFGRLDGRPVLPDFTEGTGHI